MSLEQRFRFLDAIPQGLYRAVVTHTSGTLRQRVEGIVQWRTALLKGQLPDPQTLAWPPQAMSQVILRRLDALGLAAYCKDEASLVERILQDVLNAVDSLLQKNRPVLDTLFNEHKKTPEQDLGEGEAKTGEIQPCNPHSGVAQAQSAGDDASALAALDDLEQTLQTYWQKLLAHWREVNEIFNGLNQRPGAGWDLSQGLLQHQDWRVFVQYRRLIAHAAQLKAVVDSLGRHAPEPPPTDTRAMQHARAPVHSVHKEAPMQTQGLHRSADLARMLPSEAMLLAHPALKMLWHARRAERALLCYEVDGVLSAQEPCFTGDVLAGQTPMQPPLEPKGPVLLCLDTSGSMRGRAERAAKAVTLEVLRVLHQERREAYVFLFGGSAQIIRMRLSLQPHGFKAIIRFLRQSFHGGTDVAEALRCAMQAQSEQGWHNADILVLSDGRFAEPRELIEPIREARRTQGLRVHGLIFGSWRGIALRNICDPIHRFNAWHLLPDVSTDSA